MYIICCEFKGAGALFLRLHFVLETEDWINNNKQTNKWICHTKSFVPPLTRAHYLHFTVGLFTSNLQHLLSFAAKKKKIAKIKKIIVTNPKYNQHVSRQQK